MLRMPPRTMSARGATGGGQPEGGGGLSREPRAGGRLIAENARSRVTYVS